MRLVACISFVLLCVVSITSVSAQPVPSREPSSTHIFPAGGRRGTAVPVFVGGECIPPEMGFRIWGEGVSAPALLGSKVRARLELSPRREPREVPICYPKEWESKIEIAADAPLRTAMWRLTCARGGTGTRPFIVGDLPEFIESESNSLPERAERITLPVTVNGRIAGESDLDYFVFSATAGDIVTCEVVAGRIGSPLDPVVELRRADSGRVAHEEHRIGSDPVLRFRVPESGNYRLMICNVSFHGSAAHVYRMNVTTGPHDPLAPPPTAVTSEADADRGPATVETADNAAASPMALSLPAAIVGRFETATDEDWFRFRAKKDQAMTISCRPHPAGSSSLPILAILNEAESLLAQTSSVETPNRACWLDWRAPADGDFRIRLRDLQHGARGGPAFTYRLSVREASPDFSLALAGDFTNVVQGGRTELPVNVRRTGGFTGAVDLSVEVLPPGLKIEPAQIAANQNSTKLVLVADTDARPTDAALRVLGRTTIGEGTLERTASAPHFGRDAEGVSVGSPVSDRLQLTVQHKPVFRLYCNEAYQYAHRGTIYPYAMQVERLDGFDGPITIQLGDRQNRDLDGVQFIEVTVPPGQTDAKVPIFFPESMHINVLSQSQLYAQGYAFFTDKWGQRQSTLVVSEKRNMVRTMPTVVKLASADRELPARPGATVQCRLALDRTSNFTGAMEVELVEPRPEAGFAAEKVRIDANQQTAEIAVRVPAEVDRTAPPILRFRARGQFSPEVTVVSEATVPLKFD